jgi:hypothetical protein
MDRRDDEPPQDVALERRMLVMVLRRQGMGAYALTGLFRIEQFQERADLARSYLRIGSLNVASESEDCI